MNRIDIVFPMKKHMSNPDTINDVGMSSYIVKNLGAETISHSANKPMDGDDLRDLVRKYLTHVHYPIMVRVIGENGYLYSTRKIRIGFLRTKANEDAIILKIQQMIAKLQHKYGT